MRNYYVNMLILLLGISTAVLLSCRDNSAVGPNLYFAEEEEYVAFLPEGFGHFHVQNLYGNVTIENSDNDSVKIKIIKMSTSEFSEEVAKKNMLWIAAGLDTAVQDTIAYIIYWEVYSYDINLRVDLEIQVPAGIDFSSSITSKGLQDIIVNIPRDNTGKINIFNNEGDVSITLPQSASARIMAEVGVGSIIFDTTFTPEIEKLEQTHYGVVFQGILNDGVGLVQIFVDMGNIIFSGS